MTASFVYRPLVILVSLAAAILVGLNEASSVVPGDGAPGPGAPTRPANLTRIGGLDFTKIGLDDANTDVWAHGKFAYVGTFAVGTESGDFCPETGIKVVDISNPMHPTFVKNIPSPTLTHANDVKVQTVNTPYWRGDLLVHTNEPCAPGGDGGIRLYDVSDPRSPQLLSSIYDLADLSKGSPTGEAFGVHNTFIFQQGQRAYVEVVANVGPSDFDFRIVDVTNPRKPVEAGRWSATESPDAPAGLAPRGISRSLGLHDVWASPEGTIAYLSYWDSGFILLDISSPTQPKFLGNSTWQQGDEGNAHAAVPARNGQLLVTTDEDFSARGPAHVSLNNATTPLGTVFEALEGNFTQPLADISGSITGDLAWVGLGSTARDSFDDPAFGCSGGSPYGESVSGKIALIERGFCSFQEKFDRAASEGASAVIIFHNDPEGDLLEMGGTTASISGVFINNGPGEALADLRESGASVNLTLTEGEFDGFGFGRIFDISDPENPALLSTIELPSTNDPTEPNPFGVHNVVVRGSTAYFSWYQDGLVVVDISRPEKPAVIASFDDDTSNYWGVYTQGDLIFASDRATGLHIFKHVP